MLKARLINFSPGRLLLFSFLFAIAMGTLLLSLPIARTTDISFINLLFSATSATCVTGLSVVPLSSFTLFGQCVILSLIQIGGLGLMTLSFFFASLFLNLGMTTRLMAGQILEFQSWGKIRNFVILIVGVTVGTELIGMLLLFSQFIVNYPFEEAFFYSFFHAISAFCNAGISPLDSSLITYNTNMFFLGIISFLMLSGSIGFIVWYDVARMVRCFLHCRRETKIFTPRPSLHTTIALASTAILTLLGACLIFILEYHNLLADFTLPQKIGNALFSSLSARGVGFSSIVIGAATQATLFLFLPLMFIGANPGSTGSGIKTTTFVVFIASLVSMIRGRKSVEIRKRTIPFDLVFKAMAIFSLALFWIFFATFLLLISEKNFNFMSILFEVVSAFGTCGFSTGITPFITVFAKILLMITMLIGRIGSLTLILAWRKKDEQYLYTYPEERIMIG